jgi:hypothetical protein
MSVLEKRVALNDDFIRYYISLMSFFLYISYYSVYFIVIFIISIHKVFFIIGWFYFIY